MRSIKKSAQQVVVDQTSISASKPGTSKQTDTLPPNSALNTHPSEHMEEAMELDLYGPPLPPWFGDAQSEHSSDPNHGSDHQSDQFEQPEEVSSARAKKHSDKQKHKVQEK